MGEHHITTNHDEQRAQPFMKALLNDLTALEQMLEPGRLGNGAAELMRQHNIGCLSVVTAYGFRALSAELIEGKLRGEG